MAKSSRRVGDILGSAGVGIIAGGVPAAFIIGNAVGDIRRARARRAFDDAVGHSEKTKGSDLNIPRFAYNRKDDRLTSVFDDEEKALDELHPGWRKRSAIRKFILKRRIRSLIANPQFSQKYNSVFVPKMVDGRILAHELGHASDNAEKPLGRWERAWWHPKAIVPFIADPENTPLMRQETKAWDIARVPVDDELRTAALNTYRESQESVKRPYRYALKTALLGTILAGSGLAVNKLTENRIERR